MAKWLARQGRARMRPPTAGLRHRTGDALLAVAPQAELIAGPFVADTFTNIDLIAISPGVPVQEAQVQQAIARGIPVVSEIELFAWGMRQLAPSARVIAITGSNGKTTTTALTAYLLNAVGVSRRRRAATSRRRRWTP